jgi:hypothetical protein
MHQSILSVTLKMSITSSTLSPRMGNLFSRPLGGPTSTGDVDDFRCIRVEKEILESFPCETWKLRPKSPSCEFCIVSTSTSGKDQRLLERDASLLIRATDAFGRDPRERSKPAEKRSVGPFLPPSLWSLAQGEKFVD